MWNKIKSLFNKNTDGISNEVAASDGDEYDGVHYTLDSCPSCGYKFESIPKRKKKCPECKAYTFVRTNYQSKKKILLTEKDAELLEANISRIGFLGRWITTLGEYGISEKAYYKQYKKACNQKGFDLTHSDFIWSMFNKLVSEIREPHSLKMLYFSMALFLREENKDFYKVLRESKKWELLEYSNNGLNLNKVEISVANDSCEACKKQEGKIYTIDKALKDMPLPCKDCSYHDNFCRCMYLLVLK